MTRHLVLALVLSAACSGASAPAASAAPSASAAAALTPRPETAPKVGASIDLHRFPLGPGPQSVLTTEWREPSFEFTRLVPSWEAETPEGTWITFEAQARRASGGETAWYSLGTWAFGDATVKRATVDGQRDADARVDTDTLLAAVPLSAYRLRVTLAQRAGVSTRGQRSSGPGSGARAASCT